MPKAPDGPRVFFVVPGCSLSNTELMERYDIQDEGDPTIEDVRRLRSDIAALKIQPYLIGIMHQLVGIDLERDLFYLPLPGEKVQVRSRRKPRVSNVEAISSRNGLGLTPKALSSLSNSPSKGDLASMTYSPARSRISFESSLTNVSVSDGEGSDTDIGAKPARKRRRGAESLSVQLEAKLPAGGTEEKAGDRAEAALRKRLPTRRSRRLATDAAAYKPEDDTDGQDSEVETGKGKSRGKKAGRGRKRARTADDVESSAVPTEMTKRRKRTTTPLVDAEKVNGSEEVTKSLN